MKPVFVLALGTVLSILIPTSGRAQHALGGEGPYDPSVPTPASVLGYELGDRFTPHHVLMRYVDAVAAASPRVHVDTVAHTFEGRELLQIAVTSEANRARLDEIRANAARLADPRRASDAELAATVRETPTIVWLGHSVHGDEASGVEAAIGLLYQLAAGNGPDTRVILDSAVVLIDPVQNPDGHERHVQDVMQARGAVGIPTHPDARIHETVWPGPRTSHYHFDLNRDWFIHSHPETRGRVRAMLAWWPHVAADLHEMGTNSTYFFPPSMLPHNQNVPQNIKDWWQVIAEGNAAAFDRHGWSFFTREGYDEFYVGYGSSWPIYTGAVGMTYEQGSSEGGAIRRDDGTVITLREAAAHHYTAGFATALTTARRRQARVSDYLDFRRTAITGPAEGGIRSVVFGPDAQGRADSLAHRLLANGIEVHRLPESTRLRATPYGEEGGRDATLPAGAYVVDLSQPQGRLAKALLEPEAALDSAFIREELERRRQGRDSRFYDVTGWSLPFAYRVPAWWSTTVPGGLEPVAEEALLAADAVGAAAVFVDDPAGGGTEAIPGLASEPAGQGAAAAASPATAPQAAEYGYAFAPGSDASFRMLAALLADSVRVWHAPYPFRAGGTDFPQGAFVVRVARNDDDVHESVRRAAAASGAPVASVRSALVGEGTDLGSNSVDYVRPPRVALAAGPPVSGYSFGYAWYVLDQRLKYPSTPINVGSISPDALEAFDVLVLPSAWGSLGDELGESGRETIGDWVRGGGTLITLEGATEWLADEDTGLSEFRILPDTARADGEEGAPLPKDVPGAIVRVVADTLSPLLAGVRQEELPALYFSDVVYDAPDDFRPGERVIDYAAAERLRMSGYMWPEVPERLGGTPYLWTESVGDGRVIAFAGEPNFRDQWPGLRALFANAVLLGPSM